MSEMALAAYDAATFVPSAAATIVAAAAFFALASLVIGLICAGPVWERDGNGGILGVQVAQDGGTAGPALPGVWYGRL